MADLTTKFIDETQELIIGEKWKIGERLPSLRALTLRFGVSRSVINAAVSALTQKGFLTVKPRQYIEVADWKTNPTLEILTVLVRSGKADERAVSSLFESRLTIERESSKLAIIYATEEDLLRIQLIIDKEKAALVEEMPELDLNFHQALIAAGHNMVYSAIQTAFSEITLRFIHNFYLQNPDVKNYIIEMHQAAYYALMNKDKNVEKIITTLLKHGSAHTKLK